MKWSAVLAAGMLAFGCGDGTSGSNLPGTGSPSPASSTYQTDVGFCRGRATLSGGDLTGTWTVFTACAISSNAPANCADTKLDLSLAAQGTVTFNADLSASIDVTIDLKKDSIVPVSCASAGDCASLESTLAGEVGTGAGASATCSPASSDPSQCACEQSYGPRALQGSGDYRFVMPNYLSTTGLNLQGGFLVEGNTLRLDGVAVSGTLCQLLARR